MNTQLKCKYCPKLFTINADYVSHTLSCNHNHNHKRLNSKYKLVTEDKHEIERNDIDYRNVIQRIEIIEKRQNYLESMMTKIMDRQNKKMDIIEWLNSTRNLGRNENIVDVVNNIEVESTCMHTIYRKSYESYCITLLKTYFPKNEQSIIIAYDKMFYIWDRDNCQWKVDDNNLFDRVMDIIRKKILVYYKDRKQELIDDDNQTNEYEKLYKKCMKNIREKHKKIRCKIIDYLLLDIKDFCI
jgi:hypothetical protein